MSELKPCPFCDDEPFYVPENEAFRLSEVAKDRQCWKCRAMIGLLALCPHCGSAN